MQTANCLMPAERLQLRPSASEQSRQQDPRQSTANIAATAFCLSGLFDLLAGGALEQTVRALMTR